MKNPHYRYLDPGTMYVKQHLYLECNGIIIVVLFVCGVKVKIINKSKKTQTPISQTVWTGMDGSRNKCIKTINRTKIPLVILTIYFFSQLSKLCSACRRRKDESELSVVSDRNSMCGTGRRDFV